MQVSVGQRYGYRERKRAYAEPVRPVEVVKLGPPKSQKARVRWLDGEYEGLEEWVPKVRLVVDWDEAAAFIRDEERMVKAWDTCDDVYKTPEWEAVSEVFMALPKNLAIGFAWEAQVLVEIEDLDGTIRQLGLRREELLAEAHAYVDRFGHYYAPFPVAARLARICCQRFAPEILQAIKVREDADRQAVASGHYVSPTLKNFEFDVDRVRMAESLRAKERIWSEVRQWCGEETVTDFNETLALREELERLRKVIESTAEWLRANGQSAKATSLLREIGKATAQPDQKGRRSKT